MLSNFMSIELMKQLSLVIFTYLNLMRLTTQWQRLGGVTFCNIMLITNLRVIQCAKRIGQHESNANVMVS